MRRAVIAALVVLGAAPAAARAGDPYVDAVRGTAGLTHYWRFEEAPLGPEHGTQYYADAVGGQSATVAPPASAPGVTDDGGRAFSGTRKGRVWVSGNTWAEAPFTIELWARVDRWGRDIVGRNNDGATYLEITSGGSLRASIRNTHGTFTALGSQVALGRWHHVALAFDGGAIRLVLDGEDVTGATTTSGVTAALRTSAWVFGGRDGHGVWPGAFDEIAVYDRALDVATVRRHFRAGEDGRSPVLGLLDAIVPFQRDLSFTAQLSGARAGTTFGCQVDGGGLLPCDLVGQPVEGVHAVTFYAIDRFGNAAAPLTRNVLFDRTPPATLALLRYEDGTQRRVTAMIGGEPEGAAACEVDGEPWPCARRTTLPQGATRVVLRAVDAAGNVDPSGSSFPIRRNRLSLDTAGVSTGSFSFASSAEIEGYECSLDGAAFSPCESPLELGLLRAGPHALTVRALRARGDALVVGPLAWNIGATAVRLLSPIFPVVVERSKRAGRRPPKLRFALTAATPVTLTLRRRGARRAAASTTIAGVAGANAIVLPKKLRRVLRLGRYVLTVRAGTDVQSLAFAVVQQRL